MGMEAAFSGLNGPTNRSLGTFDSIFVLWQYLGRRRRLQFFLLFLLMIMSVFAEMLSIGAAIPFLGALTAPDNLLAVPWMHRINGLLGIRSANDLLLPLTTGFVALFAVSSGIRVFQLWFNAKLTAAMGIQLRCDLYAMVLHKPYEFHVARNSSELISLTSEKVGVAIGIGIMQVLQLVTALVMSCAVASAMLLVSSLIAVAALVVLGGSYILTGYLVRSRIEHNSLVISENQPQAVKCMQEGLGGIREVIIDGSQEIFSHGYAQSVTKLQYAGMQNVFLSGLPKSLLELMTVALIAVLAYSMQTGSADQQVLPLLGALAFGSQRLLPSLQQIYFSWSNISGCQATLADIAGWLLSIPPASSCADTQPNRALGFKNSIVLRNVSFRYAGSERDIFQKVCLVIPKGSRTGFIGTTGSGKTTLLDLVMGLLSPTHGQLLVDGVVVDKSNVRAWQKNIAHVSQSIFLADASIAENIAFGVVADKMDLLRVKEAARRAQIDVFVEALPDGYRTLVGERGVRLSGGQRQRIGVARALYKQAQLLVLDEATSALDGETEKEVMKAINGLSDDLTILIIAHRLSTLEGCNRIIELAQNRACVHERHSFNSA